MAVVTGVGARYKQLSDAGELWVYEGQRTTPVGLFISDLAGELAGAKVEACGCDQVPQERSCLTRFRPRISAGRSSGADKGRS